MQAESSNAAAAKRATGWDVAPPHSRLVSSTSNYFAAGALSPLCAARRPRGAISCISAEDMARMAGVVGATMESTTTPAAAAVAFCT